MPVAALVVDDSPTARQIIGYHLRQIGCRVVGEAASAADGLKLFNQLRPNLVTLDLMMPVKDGIDSLALVHEIKKAAPDVAIIVVSVVPFEKTRQSFTNEGVFAYIVKPFNDYALANIKVKLKRAFPELALTR